VDARIDEIVLRTLEKERALRQQSAAEVKTDVGRVAASPQAPRPAVPKSATPIMISQMAVAAGVVLFAGAAALTHGSVQNTLLALSLVPLALGLLGLFRFRNRGTVPGQKRQLTRVLAAGALLAGAAVVIAMYVEARSNQQRLVARARLLEERQKLAALKASAQRQAAANPGIEWNPGTSELPKPTDSGDWRAWAEHSKNSDVLRERGDLNGALQSALTSLEHARKIAVREPGPRQMPLSRSLIRCGDLYCRLGRPDEALKHYEESVVPIGKLLAEDPAQEEDHRKRLTQAFVKTGDVLRALGRMPEAVEAWRAAVYGGYPSGKPESWRANTEAVDITRAFDPEELARLAAAPAAESPGTDSDRRFRLKFLICRAAAEKAIRFRYLLDDERLRTDFGLPLAAYDYSVNGNESALDYILTKLAGEKAGSDCDETVVLAYVDEWERTPGAVETHFIATDGAGGINHGDFWATRKYLFPRNYLRYKIKDLEGAPLKPEAPVPSAAPDGSD
jgi:tetratricopeptide (TPR) repeat protein